MSFSSFAVKAGFYPLPLRVLLAQRILRRWPGLVSMSHKQRAELGAVDRPHYAYGMYVAAHQARQLGIDTISAIEFGVAGGNGLVSMERHAKLIQEELGVRFQVWGFDTGKGLPEPEDYRDVPYHWQPGFYEMDEPTLRRRLLFAQLVLGNVRDTASDFCATHSPARIGFIAVDVDFYSSTRDALRVLDSDAKYFLPRPIMYLDDSLGDAVSLLTPWTGEIEAINEFNERSPRRKIAPMTFLQTHGIPQMWHHQMYAYHQFDHPLYTKFVSEDAPQLVLK
jgi:hypothetical protein